MSNQANLSLKKVPPEYIEIAVIVGVGFVSLVISIIFAAIALKNLNAADPTPETTSVLNRIFIEQAISTVEENTIIQELQSTQPILEETDTATESAQL